MSFPTQVKVFAALGPTDMRKSFDGLVGIVEKELGQQVESGDLFLFFNRKRDRLKVLCFTGDGLLILYKKLEAGTFEALRGPSALAFLAEGKFARHLPLYRLQEQLQTTSHMWFRRGVLSSSLCRAARRLTPLRDLIHAEILRGFYLHANETTARLLSAGASKALQT